MTRLTLFDSPLFLGFDEIEQTFARLQKSSHEGYPPYNIEQIGDIGLRITIAVAGFTMDMLDVEIENKQLTIRGRQPSKEEQEDRVFLHRGIAARQFQRSFILADGMEIKGAWMDNGLLNIDMERLVPLSTAQKIAIQGPKKSSSKKAEGYIDIDQKD
jgi:HSP20 family molecular chaperone IbpA